MAIKTKFKSGTFTPLKRIKDLKENEIVEIEIRKKRQLQWRGALKNIKMSSVDLQHKIKDMW